MVLEAEKIWRKRIEEGILYQYSTLILMRSPVAPVDLEKSGFLNRFSMISKCGLDVTESSFHLCSLVIYSRGVWSEIFCLRWHTS